MATAGEQAANWGSYGETTTVTRVWADQYPTLEYAEIRQHVDLLSTHLRYPDANRRMGRCIRRVASGSRSGGP